MAAKRRKLQFAEVGDIAVEVQRLTQAGYTKVGAWDLSQCCKHLSLTMAASMSRFPIVFPWIFRVTIGRLIRWLMLTSGWMPSGFRAPKMLDPGEPADEAKAVNRLVRLCEQAASADVEWAIHPAFGRMSAAQWRRLHCIHAAHHLSHLIPAEPAAATQA